MNTHIDQEEFIKIVDAAVSILPSEFTEKLENVSILVRDYPTRHQMNKMYQRGEGGMLLGLYEGIPKTRRGRYGVGATIPDTITIFRGPLVRISRSKVDLIERVKSTVWHEIAHHFGMDEKMVRSAERSRKVGRNAN